MALSIAQFVSSGAWSTSGTTKTASNVSWSAGDILIAIAGLEDATQGAPPVPTLSGVTFSSIDANAAASTCNCRSSSAIAGSSGGPSNASYTIGTAKQGGLDIWVISGGGALGDHKEQHTTGKTVSSTAQGASGSIYIWCCLDFAGDGVGTGTPTVTNTRESTAGASDYLVVDKTGVSGTNSFGETGGGSAGPFSLLVVEVKDAGTAAAAIWVPRRMPLGV